MVFFELCPSDDWSRASFNEVSLSLSENIVGALTKRTQQQDELKQQQTGLSNRIVSLNIQQTPNQNYIRSNQSHYRSSNRFDSSRGYRGCENFNRGRGRFNNNRGYYGKNYNRFNNPQIHESSNNGHIAQTTYSKQIIYTCGFPNHYARDCNQRKPAKRNQQILYQTTPKNEQSHASVMTHHMKHKRLKKMEQPHVSHLREIFFQSAPELLSKLTEKSTNRHWCLRKCN